jgi:rhodanese-related sulfurtransferase
MMMSPKQARNDGSNLLAAACLKEARSYQKRFRSVQCLSSEDFLQRNYYHHPSTTTEAAAEATTTTLDADDVVQVVLLDARTAPERNVSIIQGAVPVADYYNNIHNHNHHHQGRTRRGGNDNGDSGNEVNNGTQPTIIICYCTIGYRSGLEATRLQRLCPDATVYNLDGIVAFSHASISYNHCRRSRKESAAGSHDDAADAVDDQHHHQHYQLVDPATGASVRTIHTFASVWDYLDPDHYDGVHFPLYSLPFRLFQVGARLIVRHSQTLYHHTLGGGGGTCCSGPASTTTTSRPHDDHDD